MWFFREKMWEELQQVQFFGSGNRLGAVVGFELAINVFGVVANRIDTDDQDYQRSPGIYTPRPSAVKLRFHAG